MINLKQSQKFYSTLYLFAQESFKGNTRVISWFVTLLTTIMIVFVFLLKYVYKASSNVDADTINTMISLYLASVFLTSSISLLLSSLTIKPSSKMMFFFRTCFLDENIISLVLKFLKLLIFLGFFSFFNLTQSMPLFINLSLLKTLYYVFLVYLIGVCIYMLLQIILNPINKMKYHYIIELLVYAVLLLMSLFYSFKIGELIYNSLIIKAMLTEHKLLLLFALGLIMALLTVVHINQETSPNFNSFDKQRIRFVISRDVSFELKFILMIFSQRKNFLIYLIHIILLFLCINLDPSVTFVIPMLLLPLCLEVFSNTTRDRQMNYLHGITAIKEFRVLYIILVVLIMPYMIVSLPNFNIIILKGILFNLNMLMFTMAIGYTFPADTSILDNFTSNFIVLVLLMFNIIVISVNAVVFSIILSCIINVIANIILVNELSRKEQI